MKRALGWLGPILIVIGIAHVGWTLHYFGAVFAELRQAGFWNALDRLPNEPGYPFERSAAFWCLVYGFFLVIAGLLIRFAHVHVGRLPAALGWILLAFFSMAAFMMPKAPFWVGIVLAIAAILDARPDDGPAVTPPR
jgi:hypothetical protein